MPILNPAPVHIRNIITLLISTVALFLFPCFAADKVVTLKEVRYLMGTNLEITISGSNAEKIRSQIENSAKIVSDIEKIISNYQLESELSRFNHDQHLKQPSKELIRFLDQSHQYVVESKGLFNPAIRALAVLWNTTLSEGTVPNQAQIAQAARCLNVWPKLNNKNELFSRCTPLELDSGGIGKGYAVDAVVQYLQEAGVKSALIHFGHSSSYALGEAPDGKPWRLVLRFNNGKILGEVLIRDLALSASDSLGQYKMVNGERFGHIIDPRSRSPIKTEAQSVVISNNASMAESYSKAFVIDNSFSPPAKNDFWYLVNTKDKFSVSKSIPCSLNKRCVEFIK